MYAKSALASIKATMRAQVLVKLGRTQPWCSLRRKRLHIHSIKNSELAVTTQGNQMYLQSLNVWCYTTFFMGGGGTFFK